VDRSSAKGVLVEAPRGMRCREGTPLSLSGEGPGEEARPLPSKVVIIRPQNTAV